MKFNKSLNVNLLICCVCFLTIMANNIMAMEDGGFQQLLSDIKNNQYEYLQKNRISTELSVEELAKELYINNFVLPTLQIETSQTETSVQTLSTQEPNITGNVVWDGYDWDYVHAVTFFYSIPSSTYFPYEGIDVWIAVLVDSNLYYYKDNNWYYVTPTAYGYDLSEMRPVYREYTRSAPINYIEVIDDGYLESSNPPVSTAITYILGYDTDPDREFDESSFCYRLIDATNLPLNTVAYAGSKSCW